MLTALVYALSGDCYRLRIFEDYYHACSSTNSRISPGWQFRALQIASKVENLIAFAFPVFRMDRFAMVISTFSASSCSCIFLRASMTSRFTTIGIIKWFVGFLPEFLYPA